MTEKDWQNWQNTNQPQTPESEADLADLLKKQDAIFNRNAEDSPAEGPDNASRIDQNSSPDSAPGSSSSNHRSAFSSGSLQFRGWRWKCPSCGRNVNMLFHPLPRLTCLETPRLPRSKRQGFAASPRHDDEDNDATAPINTFACEKCHGLRRQSRTDPNAWNEIVTYLSAGLLYGHEVERPKWFPKPKRADRATSSFSIPHSSFSVSSRKLAYTPRPNRSPSQRRPQIEKLLIEGKTFKQIAIKLQLCYGTVLWYAQQIYKPHGVKTLEDFLRKQGHHIPQTPHKEIRRRIMEGQSTGQIAAEMGVDKMMIYNQRQALRRRGIGLSDIRVGNGRCNQLHRSKIGGKQPIS